MRDDEPPQLAFVREGNSVFWPSVQESGLAIHVGRPIGRTNSLLIGVRRKLSLPKEAGRPKVMGKDPPSSICYHSTGYLSI